MLAGRELSFDDYLGVLRRRRWIIVIPGVLGPLIGYLITLFLTPEYTSTSTILIEQPTVPGTVVQSVTTGDLFIRLATMQEQIESRTRLQPLIERYDLYKSERKRSMEDALDEMRKAISVTPVEFAAQLRQGSGNSKQTTPGFTVNFTAEGPKLAQQVCTDLTSMFMEENLRQREQQARGTTDFLAAQVEDAKRVLDEQNAKLAEFKRRNLGSLPDDQQSNLQILSGLNSQLQATAETMSRAQQDRAYAQTLLAQEMQTLQQLQPGGPGGQSTAALEEQLAKTKEALTVLQGRYTPDYPDVIKMKSDIAALQKQIDEQTASNKNQGSDPKPLLVPKEIAQLRAQIQQDDETIHAKAAEEQQVKRHIKAYEDRLQITPLVEQEFKQLTQGHEAALKFYDDLLAKRDQSKMSADLENRQQGEQFRVLDAADLPQEPSFPVWWQFALGGLGGSLALGLGIAVLVESRDKALRDERDISFYLELPTLALVPTIGGPVASKNGFGFAKRAKNSKVQSKQAIGV